jgi:hypothetical protein
LDIAEDYPLSVDPGNHRRVLELPLVASENEDIPGPQPRYEIGHLIGIAVVGIEMPDSRIGGEGFGIHSPCPGIEEIEI